MLSLLFLMQPSIEITSVLSSFFYATVYWNWHIWRSIHVNMKCCINFILCRLNMMKHTLNHKHIILQPQKAFSIYHTIYKSIFFKTSLYKKLEMFMKLQIRKKYTPCYASLQVVEDDWYKEPSRSAAQKNWSRKLLIIQLIKRCP